MLCKALVLICVLSISHARITPGGCPKVKARTDIDYNLLQSSWFEYSRYFNTFQQFDKCVKFDFRITNGQKLDVDMVISGKNRFSNEERNRLFEFQPATETSGELAQQGFRGIPFGEPLNVVGTDYMTYAILFSCQDIPLIGSSYQYAWVLTRVPSLQGDKKKEVDDILKDNGIPLDAFTTTNQVNC